MTATISGTLAANLSIPDSKVSREITTFVRDHGIGAALQSLQPGLLLCRTRRKRRELKFDSELLYAGAMFHDISLVPAYSSAKDRFEVDGANAAR